MPLSPHEIETSDGIKLTPLYDEMKLRAGVTDKIEDKNVPVNDTINDTVNVQVIEDVTTHLMYHLSLPKLKRLIAEE